MKRKKHYNNKNCLLCIDMQNDFTSPKGNLYVKGAEQDVINVSNIINKCNYDEIIFTLDTHNYNHISFHHNWEYLSHDGNYVMCEPFTIINKCDYENGKYRCTIPNITNEYILSYIDRFELLSLPLTLWSKHCISNSWGWEINSNIKDSISKNNSKVSFFEKGNNVKTEQYSAIKPVMYSDDNINQSLLDKLKKFTNIFVCGEAMDVCVINTLLHIIECEPSLSNKICLLLDCMSSVNDANTANIIDDIKNKGINCAYSTDITTKAV